MEKFVKGMISEHAELVVRITELDNFVYNSPDADKINRCDFANMCIQLSAMKTYEKCLRARLENQNIYYEDGQYLEKVAHIKPVFNSSNKPESEEDEEKE